MGAKVRCVRSSLKSLFFFFSFSLRLSLCIFSSPISLLLLLFSSAFYFFSFYSKSFSEVRVVSKTTIRRKMEGPRPVWAIKVIMVIAIASIFFRCVSSRNHTVGGPNGWNLASNLQFWSRSTAFYTGDNLVFSYTPNHDVLEVNQLDFARCRTINPLATHRDGETVVPLTTAGTRFFICGRRGHCTRGLRLMVRVLDLPSAAPASAPAGESAVSEPTRRKRPSPPGNGHNSSLPSPAARGPPPAKSPSADGNSGAGVGTWSWVRCCLALITAILVKLVF